MKEVQKTFIRGGQGASSLERLTQSTASSRSRDRSTSRERVKPDDTGATSLEISKTDGRTLRSTVRSSYPPASGSNRTSRSNSRESIRNNHNNNTGERRKSSGGSSTIYSQQIESNSECDATNAHSDETEWDHVNKGAGPKEHTDHPMSRRSGISERLEYTEHLLDPRNEQDGAAFGKDARTSHDDDGAQDELGRRNPAENGLLIEEIGLPVEEIQSQPRSVSGKRVLSQIADPNAGEEQKVYRNERAPKELVGRNPVERRYMSARSWSGLGVDYDQTFDGTRRIQQHHESDDRAELENDKPRELVDGGLRADPESTGASFHGTPREVTERIGLQAISEDDFIGSTHLVKQGGKESPLPLELTGKAAMFETDNYASGSSGGLSSLSLELRMELSVSDEVVDFNPVNPHSQENCSSETWQTVGVSKPSSKQEADLTRAWEATMSKNISLQHPTASEEPALQRRNSDPIPSYGKPQEPQNPQGKQGVATSELDQTQA